MSTTEHAIIDRKYVMKMSRRPVPKPNFTDHFESLRIKLGASFFLKSSCFYLLCNSAVIFDISTVECFVIDRKNVNKNM